MTNPQVTRLWFSSTCQAIWIGHKVCSSGNYYYPGEFFLRINTANWLARDRRWQDTKEYPTIVPWSLLKRHLRDCLVVHLKSPKNMDTLSPNSTRRRLNVHLETRRIWAIFIQMKANDRSNLVPRAFPSKNGWGGKRPWHRLVTCLLVHPKILGVIN